MFKNRVYQVSGGQPIPAGDRVDFAGLVRAAGYAEAHAFEDIDVFAAELPRIFAAPGPTLVELHVDEVPDPPRGGVIARSFAAQAEAARAVLAGDRGGADQWPHGSAGSPAVTRSAAWLAIDAAGAPGHDAPPRGGRTMNREDCILYSGAAGGAEAAFGEEAEWHGIEEVNFTFEGHKDARTRGIHVLDHLELKRGDVSLKYVSKLMHRSYHDTQLFKKVLQCIWHQVNSGQEIYVVGHIVDDNTVKGGTGWGAEFAKLCNKPLFVFDQQKDGWFRWDGDSFVAAKDPVIGHPLFTGTGTRFLEDNGRKAIKELFDRSFGSGRAQ